jgi:hypothetical protein
MEDYTTQISVGLFIIIFITTITAIGIIYLGTPLLSLLIMGPFVVIGIMGVVIGISNFKEEKKFSSPVEVEVVKVINTTTTI